MLGASLAGQKKYAEAEPFLVQGYEGLKERKGKIPALLFDPLVQAGERLAHLYEVSGRNDEAKKLSRQLPAKPVEKKTFSK